MKSSNQRAPLMISGIYFLFGFFWILLSDAVLAQLVPDQAAYMRLQTYKGWIYVALTTGLIYLLVGSYARRKNRLLAEIAEREEAAVANLQEKEILLKEVHHRVKNNLQLVQSMLRLQAARKNVDPEVLVREFEQRIYSIALTHELMYGGEELSRVDLSDYVSRLTTHLISESGEARPELELRLDSCMLNLDFIVPCGIIVNELITNSLKYAFPERPGRIQVELREAGKGRFRLVLADDGRGYDPAAAQEGFGLQLVTILSRQIGGELHTSTGEAGTRVELEFSPPE